MELTQPHSIEQIIEDANLKGTLKPSKVPAETTKTLHKDEHGTPHTAEWNCRSIIGKLLFLEKSTRPEIACAVHQCARFSSKPKQSHTKAVIRIVKHLVGEAQKGLQFKPDPTRGLECYADAGHCGLWQREFSHDPMTAKSRTGYVIMYAGCPMVWASRIQTELTALSTCEAECVALSASLREVISIQGLLQELQDNGFINEEQVPAVHCKAFEDNSGALELATMPKVRARTKHINVKCHHFREAVHDKRISTWACESENQLADIFTEPLGQDLFLSLRKRINGY